MTWPPDDFFLEPHGELESRALRPLGQGDVFNDVPVAIKTKFDGQARAQAKLETAIVVSSSCGMRKGARGSLTDLLHVAPIRRLASLAPHWEEPRSPSDFLAFLPLPGLDPNALQAANLARIGLASTESLAMENRLACVTQAGMRVLKARLATYFVRAEIPDSILEVSSHEEWNELDLWELWANTHGAEEGFQDWLNDPNPNYPTRTRRETIYDDVGGLREQVESFEPPAAP